MDPKARLDIQHTIAQAAKTANQKVLKVVHIQGGKWIAALMALLLLSTGIFIYRYDTKKTLIVNFVDYGTYLRNQTDSIPPAKDWGLPGWSDTPEK